MTRCGELNPDGIQCPRTAVGNYFVHLDGELYNDFGDDPLKDEYRGAKKGEYSYLASWVAVPLCAAHAKAFDMEPRHRVIRGRTVKDCDTKGCVLGKHSGSASHRDASGRSWRD